MQHIVQPVTRIVWVLYTTKQGRTNFSIFGLWFNVIRLLVIGGPVTLVTPRHRFVMMHELKVDAYKDRFQFTHHNLTLL